LSFDYTSSETTTRILNLKSGNSGLHAQLFIVLYDTGSFCLFDMCALK